MFHIGHLNLLVDLRSRCDRLIVGVSTDEFNSIKGKKVVIPYAQRAAIVSEISGVDLVIPENSWQQKRDDIKKYNVDIFAIGDDWRGKFDDLIDCCEVLYLKRTEGISTTELKNTLKTISKIPKDEIIKAFEVLEQLRQDFE